MNEVRIFGATYCISIAIVFVLKYRDQFQYLRFIRDFESPARLLGVWQMPRLSSLQFGIVGGFFVISLLLIAAGLYVPCAVFLSILSYFLYFSQIRGLAYVARKTNLIPQFLLVLAVVPEMSKPFNVPCARWPILLLEVLLIQVYVSAGYSKIRNTGLNWVSGAQLQAVLLKHYMYYDIKTSLSIANNRSLCCFLSSALLVHQITFPIVLVIPNLQLVYVIAALLFHCASIFTMRINYLLYQGPAYLVFAATPLAHYIARHA